MTYKPYPKHGLYLGEDNKVYVQKNGEYVPARIVQKDGKPVVYHGNNYIVLDRIIYGTLTGDYRSYISHIDGDVYNNDIANLRPKRQPRTKKGHAHTRTDQTNERVDFIKAHPELSFSEIAKHFGCSRQWISYISKRQ